MYMYYGRSICAPNVTDVCWLVFLIFGQNFCQVMQSREVVFVGSTSNIDEHNLKFFLYALIR